MKKFFFLVPFVLLLAGCPSGTNQQKAANVAKNVATFVKQAQNTEIMVFNSGQSCLVSNPDGKGCIVITQEEHVFLEQQFKAIFTLDNTLDSCIRTSTTTAGIVQCADTAVNTVDDLNSQGVLQLKSDKARSTFTSVISAVKLGIQSISTILGGGQ